MPEPCTSVEIIGHVWGVDGFSETNRELALALAKKGFSVKLTPLYQKNMISNAAELPPDIEAKISSICQQPLSNKHASVHHYSLQGMQFINQAAIGSIFYGVYETNSYPLVWKYMLNKVPMFKEIWTPSNFNRQTFSSMGLPIHVLPHGINTDRFTPEGPKLLINDMGSFNFLSCFTWKKLKGFDVLLKAYLEEFGSGKDNTTLILKAYMGTGNIAFEKNEILSYIRQAKQLTQSKAKVLLIVEPLSYTDMASLHRTANCFVLPTRGEGWGKNIMESMACGVPVIVTNGSGYMDYVNKSNSLLIDSKQEEITDVEWLIKEPICAGHKWFEPNINSLKKHMRWAYSHPNDLKLIGDKALQSIEPYKWDKVVDIFIKEIMDFGVRHG